MRIHHGWPSQLDRGTRALVALLLLHLAVKIGLWFRMRSAALEGDEFAYADAGRALANLVRDLVTLQGPDTAELRDDVVANGWFMPGPSAVLSPLFLVDPDAGLTPMRTYLGVLTSLLLLVTVLLVRRWLGSPYALGVAVFPGLMPLWVMDSFTAWGDAVAGLAAVVLVAFAARLAWRLRDGSPLHALDGVALGLLCAACLYLRSSALPLVVGVLALSALGVVVLGRDAARVRGVVVVAVAVASFMAALAPWSLAASRTFGTPVLTTTSLPLSLGVTFGDHDRLCFGPCRGTNIWRSSVRYSRDVARANGTDELTVQREMSRHARAGLSPRDYARDVRGNFRRYALQPTKLERRWRQPGADAGALDTFVVVTSGALYAAFLAALVAAVLLVTRRSFSTQIVSLLVKVSAAALFVQPLVHVSTSRYWPIFAPLAGVAAGLLWQQLRSGQGEAGARHALVVGQHVLLWTIVAAVAGVLVLGW